MAERELKRSGDVEEVRNIDDPARLAEEARENVSKAAADLRGARVPIETEPPTTFRPS